MHVTVIGHSCLEVETRAGTVLVDPWLSGSCYWRSWWHFPPSREPDDEMLRPDWIYLTHHHFDHFHFPSMRRLDKGAEVLVPRCGVDVMSGEVRDCGVERVRELPHGRRFLAYWAAIAVILPMALSRLLVGVHWLSDLIGGALLGLVVCALVQLAWQRHPRPRLGPCPWHLLGVASLVLVAARIAWLPPV